MPKKKKAWQPCYLCGQTREKMTRDHVPPRNMFPPPLPDNMITVDCCDDCHKPLSLDDEAFTAFIAMAHGVSGAGKWILRNKVFGGSLKHSPKLKAQFSKSWYMGKVQTPTGTKSVPVIAMPEERANNYLTRMTKALLRYFHPTYDYQQDNFTINLLYPHVEQHVQYCNGMMPYLVRDQRGDGVFTFWHGVTDCHKGGAWIYTFFDNVRFAVVHQKAGHDGTSMALA